jgi:hypothetical protein
MKLSKNYSLKTSKSDEIISFTLPLLYLTTNSNELIHLELSTPTYEYF